MLLTVQLMDSHTDEHIWSDWLERSFEEEGGVYYLRSPDWGSVAFHPRFQALWDRVGLRGRHPMAEAGARSGEDPS